MRNNALAGVLKNNIDFMRSRARPRAVEALAAAGATSGGSLARS